MQDDRAAQADAAAQDGGYPFGKSATLWGFSLFIAMMVLDFADRMIMAALLPLIRAEWQISDGEAGLLNSALFIGMVLFSFPVSIAIDRWSRVKTAALMGAFWSLASGAGAFAHNIAQLAVTRAAVGSAQAGYSPAAAAWIMAAFPRRRLQLALGTFSAGQPIGMALGVALGGYIASQWGWRHALGIMALPGFLVAFLLYRARDYATPGATSRDIASPAAPPTFRAGLSLVSKTPTLRWVYLHGAMITMQLASITYFLPTLLNRELQIPLQSASYMASGALMMGVVGAPLGGWLIDAWNIRYAKAKVVFPCITALIATLLFVLAFSTGASLTLRYACVLGAVFMVTAGSSGPFAISQELVHPGIRALSMTCYALASHVLGSVPGPALTGLLSDHTNLRFALLVIALFSGSLAAISLHAAKRHYLDDLGKARDAAARVTSAPF